VGSARGHRPDVDAREEPHHQIAEPHDATVSTSFVSAAISL
jgi:hypothetical protein